MACEPTGLRSQLRPAPLLRTLGLGVLLAVASAPEARGVQSGALPIPQVRNMGDLRALQSVAATQGVLGLSSRRACRERLAGFMARNSMPPSARRAAITKCIGALELLRDEDVPGEPAVLP